MAASAEEFEYEVFLSYDRRERGAGSFFPLQLHEHLNRNGIRTYKYSEDLEEGEEIVPAVHQAIEASRIAVVILSKDYASSASCLSELAKILEQKNQMGRKELPLFYRVEPSWVRYQKESYDEAMMEHERRYGSGSAKVAGWREALTEVGERRGWTLGANEEDAELARGVAGEIGMILRQLQAPTFPIISPEHLHWDSDVGRSTDVFPAHWSSGVWGSARLTHRRAGLCRDFQCSLHPLSCRVYYSLEKTRHCLHSIDIIQLQRRVTAGGRGLRPT